MCVLILSTTLVRKISHSTKKWASFDHKCAHITNVQRSQMCADHKCAHITNVHRSQICTDHECTQITNVHTSLMCTDHKRAQITNVHKSRMCTDHRCAQITNVHRSSCKVLFIPLLFERNLNLLHIFSKNSLISNLIKILPVGAELCHADGQTWRTYSQPLFVILRTREKWTENDAEGSGSGLIWLLRDF
jgi:hypothetical protein